MKGFFKFLLSILAVFGTVIGALTVFDKYSKRNEIKGDYLKCDTDDYEENEETTEE